jgi:hypothetical protein
MTWQNDEDFKTAYNNFTCDYNPAQINVAYYFWKKSRESLVVELPIIYIPTDDSDYDEGFHTGSLLYQDRVVECLDELGVKWK